MQWLRKPVNGLKSASCPKFPGLPIPTIRYYLQEGLLPPPIKTGKTMAYYDPECVERIKLIKRLQRERFLPIEVIRRLIDSGEVSNEDSEIGQVLTKSGPAAGRFNQVPEHRIAEYTGYPSDRIQKLIDSGLISAQKGDDGFVFDALDCELIELAKKREEAGLPLDFSIVSFQMYKKALDRVVTDNTRRVLVHLVDNVPSKNIGKALQEVEDSLDRLVLVLRQKAVRRINNNAMRQLNELADRLESMFFLPVPGRFLPEVAPEGTGERLLYHLCAGEYREVLGLGESRDGAGRSTRFDSALVLARLLMKDTGVAVDLVESTFGPPDRDLVKNSLAALAYVQASAYSAGITLPIDLVKKAMPYLQACENAHGGSKLVRMLAKYVCGTIYLAIPEVFGLGERGLLMLAKARALLKSGKLGQQRLPRWIAQTLDQEIAPAVEVRINELLAMNYVALLKQNND